MHRYFFTPLLLSALALARPQTPADTTALAGLPACAQDAANSALGSSGCASTDKACICSSKPFISAITTAVTQTCTAQDVQAALIFAQTYCGSSLSGAADASSSPSVSGSPTLSASASSTPDTSDGDSYGGSTTTVPSMIVTSTTSVSGATGAMTTMSGTASDSSMMTSMMASGVMMTTTQCTTTTTIMTNAAKTAPFNSTYTGAAIRQIGQGMMAAAIGVAGAVALL